MGKKGDIILQKKSYLRSFPPVTVSLSVEYNGNTKITHLVLALQQLKLDECGLIFTFQSYV